MPTLLLRFEGRLAASEVRRTMIVHDPDEVRSNSFGRLPSGTFDRGASLVEYALLVALIAIVCFAAVMFFGGSTSETFSRVGDSVAGA